MNTWLIGTHYGLTIVLIWPISLCCFGTKKILGLRGVTASRSVEGIDMEPNIFGATREQTWEAEYANMDRCVLAITPIFHHSTTSVCATFAAAC
jgi:hypothetical protein